MKTNEICTLLRESVPVFSSFSPDVLRDIVDGAVLMSAEKNEAVVEFGKPGERLGVLLAGRVDVSVVLDSGEVRHITTLEAPDIFGEMSLLTGEKATADVIGLERCEIMWIPQSVFTGKMVSNPAALQSLGKLLAARATMMAFDEHRDDLLRRSETESDDPYGFKLKSEIPGKVLVINCGSSSLKFRLFDTEAPAADTHGQVERIGDPSSVLHLHLGDKITRFPCPCNDHDSALAFLFEKLQKGNILCDTSEITAVGHRVVHGGEKFTSPTVVNDMVLSEIEAMASLAPLHNPVNLAGIRSAMRVFPDAIHVAVFDTTFHHTLPPYAYLYGLPLRYYTDLGVRRYGFHGTSHAYVSLKAAQFVKRAYNELETIVCHLGNGASVCAVDHGRSVDTSMGLTPTAGVPMGTRSGDVDPGALCFISRLENMDIDALDTMLNHQSGLLGISGKTNDMRELEHLADDGDSAAQLAIKTFCYQIRKYIGAYVAAMQGLDVLVFTGGIGENSTLVRTLATQGLGYMGIEIDPLKNRDAVALNEPADISADRARVRVLVIPTNEELMIARHTLGALERFESALRHGECANIPIEVSAHHVHLSEAHVAALFGEGHGLTPVSELSQPGQFACAEQVNLVGPKGTVSRVRVLGPARRQTQVEVSMTEQFRLGIHPPIRESGDLKGTPGVTLEGPNGKVTLNEGVICAMRHIHMSPHDALKYGVRDRYIVRVVVDGDRELTFGDVLIRVSPSYRLAMHLDTDEANAAHLSTGAIGRIDGVQSRHGGV
jgi:acetate kinase